MVGLLIGVGLMILGLVLFVFSKTSGKRNAVNASGGSVAIGGYNTGTITNINTNSKSSSKSHGVTIIAIIVEMIGIGVTIWHAVHLVGR